MRSPWDPDLGLGRADLKVFGEPVIEERDRVFDYGHREPEPRADHVEVAPSNPIVTASPGARRRSLAHASHCSGLIHRSPSARQRLRWYRANAAARVVLRVWRRWSISRKSPSAGFAFAHCASSLRSHGE
jgi:hypothetical protein